MNFCWNLNKMEVVKKMKIFKQKECHDLSFGFVTKAKAWKGANQKCNLGVTFAFPGLQGSV
jgi:hypothetical protein